MKSIHTTHSVCLLAVTILCSLPLAPTSAPAANVTWGTPQQITGISDVSTTGNLIGAFNVGDTGVPSTTVNGVLFQSFAAPGGNGSSGNFTMTPGGGGVFASNTGAGSGSGTFTTLPIEYRTLLMSRVTPLFDPITLSISGLIVGAQYQLQWWANDSSSSFNYQITGTAGNSVTLGVNTEHANGGLGQWVIGSFTADAATQGFRFLGDGDGGVLNGFQLRQIPALAPGVPESGGTFALLGFALAALLFAQRNFRRATSR